jgi:FlaA1/EpsC-like NDP-sugar epimerase
MSPDKKSYSIFSDARVLITGVCGTIGSELLRQTLDLGAREVIGIDNNETAIFGMAEHYRQDDTAKIFFADVRDLDSLTQHMKGVDIVIHAAALKHVIVCEKSPRDAIRTNIIGVQNLIDAALANNVQRVIFTSSDKAVNPTNVMGTSKLMGERLITAASALVHDGSTVFASTRFGNVLGSRGSVIPLFIDQIKRGGPLTITDERMTRFIMSIQESVRLVLDSVEMAIGGEVFVTKMPSIKILDLAKVMIGEMSRGLGPDRKTIAIEFIGAKPGEKLYEELLNEEETRRSVELDRYFVILPAFRSVYGHREYKYPELVNSKVLQPYDSRRQQPMAPEELRSFLRANRLI